jgi:hypothetical protein
MAMNNTILITGASSGIGKACAERLASTGHQLILTARRADRLNILADELRAKGIKVYTSMLDVRDRAACEAFVYEIPAEFRHIRVLINNAGLAAGLGPVQLGDLDHWDRMIDTNVKGLLYVSKAVIPLMYNVEGAQIVNIGSIAGKEVYPGGNVYCASKHAVDALTRSMRIDLLEKGIRVSSVSPGMVETEFSIVRFDGDAEKASSVYKGLEPLVADDVANAVNYIVTAPFRITIADILIFPAAQASSRDVLRRN